MTIEVGVVDCHCHLVGKSHEDIQVTIGKATIDVVDGLDHADHLSFADQRYGDNGFNVHSALGHDFRIDAGIIGGIVDKDRLSVFGHPTDHPLTQFEVKNIHLAVGRIHEADLHIGAIVIDAED